MFPELDTNGTTLTDDDYDYVNGTDYEGTTTGTTTWSSTTMKDDSESTDGSTWHPDMSTEQSLNMTEYDDYVDYNGDENDYDGNITDYDYDNATTVDELDGSFLTTGADITSEDTTTTTTTTTESTSEGTTTPPTEYEDYSGDDYDYNNGTDYVPDNASTIADTTTTDASTTEVMSSTVMMTGDDDYDYINGTDYDYDNATTIADTTTTDTTTTTDVMSTTIEITEDADYDYNNGTDYDYDNATTTDDTTTTDTTTTEVMSTTIDITGEDDYDYINGTDYDYDNATTTADTTTTDTTTTEVSTTTVDMTGDDDDYSIIPYNGTDYDYDNETTTETSTFISTTTMESTTETRDSTWHPDMSTGETGSTTIHTITDGSTWHPDMSTGDTVTDGSTWHPDMSTEQGVTIDMDDMMNTTEPYEGDYDEGDDYDYNGNATTVIDDVDGSSFTTTNMPTTTGEAMQSFTIELQIEIPLKVEFSEDLANPESEEFQALENELFDFFAALLADQLANGFMLQIEVIVRPPAPIGRKRRSGEASVDVNVRLHNHFPSDIDVGENPAETYADLAEQTSLDIAASVSANINEEMSNFESDFIDQTSDAVVSEAGATLDYVDGINCMFNNG